ncbi:MAG: hypothetical protein CMJ83_01030 [Planctomycetes bacterium]|nr:hypothetical protein [Planctomycetota bacterium]
MAVRGLYLTVRFHDHGWTRVREEWASERGVILTVWHNSLMIPLGHECRHGVHALISSGRDGEFVARVFRGFGVEALRGSSTRHGLRALREAIRKDSGRGRFAVTPDGPRGPRYSFGPGVTFLASRTGIPVVPVGIAVSRAWHLRTWDRYRIPKPFSIAHLVFGAPRIVPAGARREDLAQQTKHLEADLRSASTEAAEHAGVSWPDLPRS